VLWITANIGIRAIKDKTHNPLRLMKLGKDIANINADIINNKTSETTVPRFLLECNLNN
jgi:hypothetical protein